MQFKKLSPFAKLGVWTAITLGLAGGIQLLAWLLGTDFRVLHSSGTLLALALGALLIVMAADQRDVGDYGFIVGPVWKRLFFQGMAIGAGVNLAFFAVGLLTGVFTWRETLPEARIWAKAVLNGSTAVPLSVTQQILFSGYLLTMLRDRYRWGVAVVISAALFAVLGRLSKPSQLLTPEVWPVLWALFLTATLAGLLRLKTGSILTSAGILTGWIFVRRFVGRADLLVYHDSPWAQLLAPGGDARLSPLFWGVLAVGIAYCLFSLWRHGERKVELDGPAIDADFKRVFPLSNGMQLAPIDVWIGRLWHARLQVNAAYLPRLLAILCMSTINTLLSLPERLLLPLLLRRRRVAPPVFILGTHRSGTTHLHNLLSLDPQFCSTRTYHIMNPVGCVLSGWLITPLLGLFLPGKRPMDGVRFHLFTPQEEEFAIAGSCAMSPYWGTTFPRHWPHYERYLFPSRLDAAEQSRWRRTYHFFLQKLTCWTGKRPLLKNPYNTGRMALLREMYPEARFIHLRRHPAVVFQSNMYMCEQAHVMNQLQDPDPCCSYQTRFIDNYLAMEDAFAAAARTAPAGSLAELRFEDLEQQPIACVQQLYQQLGLTYSDALDRRLKSYVEGLSGYQKNRHRPLSPQQHQRVQQGLGPLLQRWGYELDAPRRAA